MFLVPHIYEDGDAIGVTCPGSETIGEVRVKHGNDGTITLTSNWADHVDQKNLQEGDVCAFEFQAKEGYLAVIVHKM